MKYTILIIDDDKTMHVLMKGILGEDFNLVYAHDAQEGINLISETQVDMIISDIHMPGIDGIAFLESITKDADRRNIPFIIMTSQPTDEKEQKALELGAMDFIDKEKLNRDELLNLVNMKLVANVRPEKVEDRVGVNLKVINQKMMFAAASNDFIGTARSLYSEIKQQFGLELITLWTVRGSRPNLITNLGMQLPDNYGADDLIEEEIYMETLKTRQPFFNNDTLHDEKGLLTEFSRKNDLTSEMGAPLFALTDKQLVQLKMKVPVNAPIYGFVFMKRKKLFSEKEFRLLSMLLTRTGCILYRLYKAI
jgi:CheY-like chemotaxis protein